MGKRIIIAGGGTGGHIFPAVAIANALLKIDPTVELLFIGAKGKMEMLKIPQAGFKIEGLAIAGFNRSSLIKNIGLPFKLIWSFLQVRKIFKHFNPDAVVGVGGYSSFPVLRLAQQRGIKSFLHESNSFAGKTNQLLGKKATKIFVASAGMEKFFPTEKLMVTGNPVRYNIAHAKISRAEAIKNFGLDPLKTTVLSIGGSLGAKSINEAITAGLLQFGKNDLQLIWQTGEPYAAKAKAASAENKLVFTEVFITKMETAYAAADLIVSRAGAMAIAEIAVVKKPVILVPYPFAAEDHQTVNGLYLADRGAAILIKDELVSEVLVPQLIALAKDRSSQLKMIESISPLGVRNADELIAAEILDNIK
jgi:UDP-N-acetylglucosamine--N-acetylmuramyl-(pentapeptide) pyrophosphoryl-undecaprenol N-acetylglucosamine transferase